MKAGIIRFEDIHHHGAAVTSQGEGDGTPARCAAAMDRFPFLTILAYGGNIVIIFLVFGRVRRSLHENQRSMNMTKVLDDARGTSI